MAGDIRFIVRKYLSEGLSVIPIPKGEKGPRIANWQHTTFAEDAFGADDNIGVRLGEPSGHLVDLDLDCMEAVALAPRFLPDTQRKHGRPSKEQSHYFYIAEGAKPYSFKDGEGNTLLEIRSTGQQTVLPPSTHPSGEVLAWAADRSPAPVDAAGLFDLARALATAVMLARAWPPNGPTTPQHDLAGFAAGFLAARRVSGPMAARIIEEAATQARDEDVRDRSTFARQTVDKFGDGSTPISGGPRLAEIIGEKNVKRLQEWYGGSGAAHDSVVEEMNRKHFAVRIGKDHVVAREDDDEVVFQAEKALFHEYAHQKVKVGERVVSRGPRKGQTEADEKSKYEIWREHPKKRTFRKVVFSPPPAPAHDADYNLWRGLAVEPAEGDCSLFLAHIRDVICSGVEEHYEYMLNLLAFTVQQPGTPSEVAVVMKGELGTGKGVFVRNFGKLFGRHYVQLDRAEHLTGKFNASISGKVVVFADEAFFAGDKAHLGTLKRIVSEPTLQIERKGVDATVERNHMHLFMATNEEWTIPAGFNERRFFVLNVSSAHMQDLVYFTAIQQQLNDGGLAAFLKFLLDRPVTHDQIRSAPRTDELRVQQEHTMAPELKWWKICLEEGVIGTGNEWPLDVNVSHIYDDYLRWCDSMKINRRVTVIDMARRVLKDFLGPNKRGPRGDDGRRERLRSMLPLGEARQAFDKMAGTRTPWEIDEEPAALVEAPREPGDESRAKADDLPF